MKGGSKTAISGATHNGRVGERHIDRAESRYLHEVALVAQLARRIDLNIYFAVGSLFNQAGKMIGALAVNVVRLRDAARFKG